MMAHDAHRSFAMNEPPAVAPARWSWRALYWAPHRLAFALACALLMLSSLWWLNVQLARSAWLPEALQGQARPRVNAFYEALARGLPPPEGG